jgi:hypothetical protein
MFSNRIANSARFLQMPTESQLLYFHMVLRADDDGIVESYPLMRLLGVASDSFKVLMAKGFIQQLNEDQVVVINDWKEHNVIRADRKIDSIYLPLLLEVKPDVEVLLPKPRSDVKDNSKRLNGQSTDSISYVRLGKVKLSKVNKYSSIEDIKEEDLQELSEQYNAPLGFVKLKLETLKNYCESKGKTYKNYKSALRNFVLGDMQKEIQRPRKGVVIDATNL